MSYLELVAGEDGAECDCGGAVHGLVARPLLVAIITWLHDATKIMFYFYKKAN